MYNETAASKQASSDFSEARQVSDILQFHMICVIKKW